MGLSHDRATLFPRKRRQHLRLLHDRILPNLCNDLCNQLRINHSNCFIIHSMIFFGHTIYVPKKVLTSNMPSCIINIDTNVITSSTIEFLNPPEYVPAVIFPKNNPANQA